MTCRLDGDFLIHTSQNHSSYLKAGNMYVGGNFTQVNGNASSFAANTEHTVTLDGSDIQTVSFEGSASKFHHLKLTKDKDTGYIFHPDNCWTDLRQDVEAIRVSVTANDVSSVEQGKTLQFYAAVSGGSEPSQEVTWSLSGNQSNKTVISDTGLLSVADDETAETLTVIATSVQDASKSGEYAVRVEKIGSGPEETEHHYRQPEFTWTNDYSRAIAKFICTKCGQTEEVEAKIQREESEEAITYTATAEFQGKQYQDTQVTQKGEVEEKHSYGQPEFTWAEDHSSAVVKFTCHDCGDVLELDVAVNTVITAPTCTENGNGIYTASISLDGKAYEDTWEESIPANGHFGGTANCVEKAVCEACGEDYGMADGDNHIGGTELKDAKSASCLENGYSGDAYCKSCGVKISSGKEIAAIGHQYGAWTTVKEATYSIEGIEEKICNICNDKERRSIAKSTRLDISRATVSGIVNKSYTGKALEQSALVVEVDGSALMLGKDYTVAYKDNVNIGMATLVISGKEKYTSSITKTFAITVTKGAVYNINDLKYEVTNTSTDGNGTVTITGSAKKSGITKLSIGSAVEIGGKSFQITAIGNKAFQNCVALKKVTIPVKVVRIGSKAFYKCKNLKSIAIKTMKLTKKNVGSSAFKGIYGKATIRVPKKQLSSYKKLLKMSGLPAKAKIRK